MFQPRRQIHRKLLETPAEAAAIVWSVYTHIHGEIRRIPSQISQYNAIFNTSTCGVGGILLGDPPRSTSGKTGSWQSWYETAKLSQDPSIHATRVHESAYNLWKGALEHAYSRNFASICAFVFIRISLQSIISIRTTTLAATTNAQLPAARIAIKCTRSGSPSKIVSRLLLESSPCLSSAVPFFLARSALQ